MVQDDRAAPPVTVRAEVRPTLRLKLDDPRLADDGFSAVLIVDGAFRRVAEEVRSGAPVSVPEAGRIAVVVQSGVARGVQFLDDARPPGAETAAVLRLPPAIATEADLIKPIVVARVFDAHGAPVVAADVAIGYDDLLGRVQTDSAGAAWMRLSPPSKGAPIAVRADGYVPRFVTAEGGVSTLIVLPAGAAHIVATDENGTPLLQATVLVDGEPVYLRGEAPKPAVLRGLAPGRHEAIVAAPDRMARRIIFEIDDGATATITARLGRRS